MAIQFGRVEYVYAKTRRRAIAKNEAHFKDLWQSVRRKMDDMADGEKISQGMLPPNYLNSGRNREKTSKIKGYLGKMVTGPDAVKMLESRGIKINPDEPKAVTHQKIMDAMREKLRNPSLTEEQIGGILAYYVDQYTIEHERAKKPIHRVYLQA